jgi:spermidine synthase
MAWGRLLAVGALSMLGQVVLLRECAVLSFGTELVVVVALGVWLLGTAAGAAAGAAGPGGRAGAATAGVRAADSTPTAARTDAVPQAGGAPADRATRWIFVALAPSLMLSVAFARGARACLGGVPGAYLPLERQALALLVCIAPVSFLLGLLFQRSAARFVGGRRTLALAYGVESAGGVAGALLATGLAAAGVPSLASAELAATLALVAAAWSPAPRGLRIVTTVGLVLAAAGLAAVAPFDRWMTGWQHPRLIATRDTPYARVTVTSLAGQIAVFEDDALAFESEGTAAEEFVALAAIQRERVRSVLVLGGVTTGLLPEVLRQGPERVEDVELDAALAATVSEREPEWLARAASDPRVRIAFADPRRFLERSGQWDLVLIAMPEPESGRGNRLYTRECFARCAARLAPDGVLALRLRSAENLWTPLLARRLAAVHRALREEFPYTTVLPGVTNVLLASRLPLERDPGSLGARLEARGARGRLVTPAYVRYLYTNDRFAEASAVLARTSAPANTDARPSCYQTTMLLWLARFLPRLSRLAIPEVRPGDVVRSVWAWAGVAAGALLLGFARRRARARRATIVALAGAAGMALESAMLLAYQNRSGVLYQDLGLLLMAFMAGLALGAPALAGWLEGSPAGGGRARRARVATLGLLVLLAIACAARLRSGGTGLAEAALVLVAGGALVAAVFAGAAHGAPEEQRARAGPLYAYDLIGGCAGSLVAGLAVIPMLGLPATAMIAALAGACALILV